MERAMPLLLTTKLAAKYCGYGTERRFRLAVNTATISDLSSWIRVDSVSMVEPP